MNVRKMHKKPKNLLRIIYLNNMQKYTLKDNDVFNHFDFA